MCVCTFMRCCCLILEPPTPPLHFWEFVVKLQTSPAFRCWLIPWAHTAGARSCIHSCLRPNCPYFVCERRLPSPRLLRVKAAHTNPCIITSNSSFFPLKEAPAVCEHVSIYAITQLYREKKKQKVSVFLPNLTKWNQMRGWTRF